jgi:hypothetical protein
VLWELFNHLGRAQPVYRVLQESIQPICFFAMIVWLDFSRALRRVPLVCLVPLDMYSQIKDSLVARNALLVSTTKIQRFVFLVHLESILLSQEVRFVLTALLDTFQCKVDSQIAMLRHQERSPLTECHSQIAPVDRLRTRVQLPLA